MPCSVILGAMDAEAFRARIASIDATSFANHGDRLQAVRDVVKLLRRIQTPMESVKRLTWYEVSQWPGLGMTSVVFQLIR